MIPEHVEEIEYLKVIPLDKHGNQYEVTKPVQYWCENMMIGKWKLKDKKGKLVAEADIDKLTIYPGYKWDGCTGIGMLYEDIYTLQASLLHDILYEALAVKGFNPVYSSFQADYWFSQLIKILAGYKILPEVYRAALAVLGTPYRVIKKKQKTYIIEQ